MIKIKIQLRNNRKQFAQRDPYRAQIVMMYNMCERHFYGKFQYWNRSSQAVKPSSCSLVQREPNDTVLLYFRRLLPSELPLPFLHVPKDKIRTMNWKDMVWTLCVNILHNWELQYFLSFTIFAEHLFRILISFCWTFVRRHLAPVKRSR